jgi:hypothetical protein
LDREHIEAAILQVGTHDKKLKKILGKIAGNFDYPAILEVLRKNL